MNQVKHLTFSKQKLLTWQVLPYARLPAVARGHESLCECLQLRQGEHWAGAEVYIVEKSQ